MPVLVFVSICLGAEVLVVLFTEREQKHNQQTRFQLLPPHPKGFVFPPVNAGREPEFFPTRLDPSARPRWLERPAGRVYADDFPQVIFLCGTSLFYTSLLCLSCGFNDKEQELSQEPFWAPGLKPQTRSFLPNSLFYSVQWHSGISTGTAHTSLPAPQSLPRFHTCNNMLEIKGQDTKNSNPCFSSEFSSSTAVKLILFQFKYVHLITQSIKLNDVYIKQ